MSASQVSACIQRAHEAGLADRAAFTLGNAMDLGPEHASASYDAAWAIDSFAHMSDRLAALRGAFRVLRPGGRLLLTEFTRHGEPTAEHLAVWRTVWTSPPPETPPALLERTAQAGFELVSLTDHSQNFHVTGDLMDVLYRDHHDRILDRYGAKATTELDALMPLLRQFVHAHLGYYVFLLRKPG